MGFASFTEWIDEIGDKVFFLGAGFEGLFFIFDDDFVVGNFENLLTGDDEFWVDEAFDKGASDDNLPDGEIV